MLLFQIAIMGCSGANSYVFAPKHPIVGETMEFKMAAAVYVSLNRSIVISLGLSCYNLDENVARIFLN